MIADRPTDPSLAPNSVDGWVGANPILELVAVVQQRFGNAKAAVLMADTQWRVYRMPTEMVPEQHVRAVVHAAYEQLGAARAVDALDAAGIERAHAMLAHDIPQLTQWMIRKLPTRLAMRVLLLAIKRSSWTFAGSARFDVAVADHAAVVDFHDCEMNRGMHAKQTGCPFYRATFRELLRTLVSPTATVDETECCAAGDTRCRFVLRV